MQDRGRENAERRRSRARWVAREVLPHEPRIRAWLRRARLAPEDVDELVQEAYCRLAMLERIDHIDAPDAYFFSIVRNLLLRRLKRQRVAPLETIAEIESHQDERPSPEREIAGRLTYERVLGLIEALPDRCRRIVRLRKIEGWSQRQIADHLGTTEKAVEKQVWLGIRLVRAAWHTSQQDAERQIDESERVEGHRR